jgi:hypothetical protein
VPADTAALRRRVWSENEKMTVYIVQHVFERPEWEDEWNAWYHAYLKVLLGVPGFRTAQRFKAVEGTPPRYMAVYTVDSPAIFESRAYIDAGGGGMNSVRFHTAYQVWIRNLFEGIDIAPEVREGEYLASIDAASADVKVQGVKLAWLESTGFHKSTPHRGIAVVQEADVARLRGIRDLTLYRPLAAQQRPL